MRYDLGELMLFGFAAVALIALAIMIASLPFALFGWILLAFVNIFGAGILYGYWTCVVAGLGISLIGSLLRVRLR